MGQEIIVVAGGSLLLKRDSNRLGALFSLFYDDGKLAFADNVVYQRQSEYHELAFNDAHKLYILVFKVRECLVRPVLFEPTTKTILPLGFFDQFQIIKGNYIICKVAGNGTPIELVQTGLNFKNGNPILFESLIPDCSQISVEGNKVICTYTDENGDSDKMEFNLPDTEVIIQTEENVR